MPHALWDYSFADSSYFEANVAPWYVWDGTGASVWDNGRNYGGPLSALVPTSVQTPLPGDDAPHFAMADFYNRFHFSAVTLALGNVIGLVQQTITIWNSHFRDRAIENIVLTNADGITIGGQPNPPFVIHALDEDTWTITVSQDGPPTIDATITWDFDFAQTGSVAITGSRVTAWSWAPDWSSGILQRLEWKTDVLTNYDGSEQRRALRLGPRASFEFSFMAEGADRRLLEVITWGWGARVWSLPVWPDGRNLDAQLAAGSTDVPVTTAYLDYHAGGLLMFMGNDARSVEVCEVLSVSASLVTLKRPTLNTWPAGSRVYPARTARLQDEASYAHFTGDHSNGRAIFDVQDAMDWTADAGVTTYRTYPVLTIAANWIEDPDTTFTRKIAKFDPGIGKVSYDDESDIASTRQTMRYSFTSRADVDTWRKLLHALRGRHAGVWVSTLTADLIMSAPISAISQNMDIAWTGYTLYAGGDPNRRDIRIETTSGQVFYRRISSSVEVDANTERLTLDSTLGVSLNPADIRLISFMALCRQESDSAELAWWSGDVIDTVATWRSFRNDA